MSVVARAGRPKTPVRQEGADLNLTKAEDALEPMRGVGALRVVSYRDGADPAADGAHSLLEVGHTPTARLVKRLRRARQRLEQAALPELQLSPAIRALLRTEARLSRPLRLGILGEFNAGKSSLANLLAGVDSLPTAVISNTRYPTLLYHASAPEVWIVHQSGKRERVSRKYGLPCQAAIFRVEVGLPSPRLRALQVLDMPGFADCAASPALMDPTVHNLDAVIWCTVSTQAWKESERVAWEMMPPRLASRGMLVVTHLDLLHYPNDREKLLARLREDLGTSFKSIVFVSTLEALDELRPDRQERPGAAWVDSGAEALEHELGALLVDVREQRAAAALRAMSRIAHRALMRIDGGDAGTLGQAAQ